MPRKGVFDNVASSNGRDMPTRNQRQCIDSHIEASLMFKEQIRDGCTPQAERNAAKESIQGAKSDQLAVRAGCAGGSRGCNGDRDADDVDGTPAVNVGDWVPEEG